MNIEQRNTEDIHPYERNPRINDQAVNAVAASIKEFGFRSPIVVDGAGVIICGHTGRKAERIEAEVVTETTPTQAGAVKEVKV